MSAMSRELLRYIATRFGQLVLVVVIAVSINFLIPRLLPGDPIETPDRPAAVGRRLAGDRYRRR